MPDMFADELNSLNRDEVMGRLALKLPMISGEMGTTPAGIAERTGLDAERVRNIAAGRRKMKWSEYMSILFLLWNDEKGREQVEKLGLFPEALKNAMSVNRNAH
ncbi:MAG: hypothetical protein IJ608_06220 [Lachnospiraceae bacterium]|nr:hypothetical protein [Lachnospiraceae bacterium]